MNIEVQAEYSIITSSGGYNAVMTIVFFSQMGKPIFEVEGSVFFVSMLKQNLEEKKSIETLRTISVEGQEHGPIEVAILAAFLIYRYKFLS
ncbi:hypothetical protein [Paenibacillus taichungensis]